MDEGVIWCLLANLMLLGVVTASDRTILVGDSSCGGSIDLDDYDNVHLQYLGGNLRDGCRFTFRTDFSKSICVSPTKFQLHCSTIVYFDKGSILSSIHDEEYGCSRRLYSEYCTTLSPLYITFKKDYTNSGRSSSSDNLKLKIYEKDSFGNEVVDAVATGIAVIVGIIVTVVVVVVVLIIVVICCCCRRRQTSGGTVYRNPQQAQPVTATVTYPAPVAAPPQAQPMYPQPGYQPPPPQTGYQPPMQTGYQPQPVPPAGYPPAPQQTMAGYQASPNVEKPLMASAPPMEMQPPPYPGQM